MQAHGTRRLAAGGKRSATFGPVPLSGESLLDVLQNDVPEEVIRQELLVTLGEQVTDRQNLVRHEKVRDSDLQANGVDWPL